MHFFIFFLHFPQKKQVKSICIHFLPEQNHFHKGFSLTKKWYHHVFRTRGAIFFLHTLNFLGENQFFRFFVCVFEQFSKFSSNFLATFWTCNSRVWSFFFCCGLEIWWAIECLRLLIAEFWASSSKNWRTSSHWKMALRQKVYFPIEKMWKNVQKSESGIFNFLNMLKKLYCLS